MSFYRQAPSHFLTKTEVTFLVKYSATTQTNIIKSLHTPISTSV